MDTTLAMERLHEIGVPALALARHVQAHCADSGGDCDEADRLMELLYGDVSRLVLLAIDQARNCMAISVRAIDPGDRYAEYRKMWRDLSEGGTAFTQGEIAILSAASGGLPRDQWDRRWPEWTATLAAIRRVMKAAARDD